MMTDVVLVALGSAGGFVLGVGVAQWRHRRERDRLRTLQMDWRIFNGQDR
jgi:hypothetical protein